MKNNKGKETKIEFRVSEEFKENLKKKAEEMGLSLTDYVINSLEHSNFVVLKEGPEIAEALMDLRISLDKKGLTPNVAKNLQTLIFKIDGLIDSFPQNNPESGENLCEEDNDEDDEGVEEFEEDGDLI
ncbi:MAG: plasmid mobilization protein [Oscillospiraceae bacterium]